MGGGGGGGSEGGGSEGGGSEWGGKKEKRGRRGRNMKGWCTILYVDDRLTGKHTEKDKQRQETVPQSPHIN